MMTLFFRYYFFSLKILTFIRRYKMRMYLINIHFFLSQDFDIII